jgi:hypothetical protein
MLIGITERNEDLGIDVRIASKRIPNKAEGLKV